MAKNKTPAVKIELSGKLTVHTAREWKSRLLEAGSPDAPITLVLQNIEAVDISFFQLLCAFHRSLLRDKKSVNIALPVDPKLKSVMAAIGYEKRTSCTGEGEDACLWKKIYKDADERKPAGV